MIDENVRLWNLIKLYIKGRVQRTFFDLKIFHQSNLSGPLINMFKYYLRLRIWSVQKSEIMQTHRLFSVHTTSHSPVRNPSFCDISAEMNFLQNHLDLFFRCLAGFDSWGEENLKKIPLKAQTLRTVPVHCNRSQSVSHSKRNKV